MREIETNFQSQSHAFDCITICHMVLKMEYALTIISKATLTTPE